jgi:hypothetical protein
MPTLAVMDVFVLRVRHGGLPRESVEDLDVFKLGASVSLICEPLKAVWPATPASSSNPISSYFLSLWERN